MITKPYRIGFALDDTTRDDLIEIAEREERSVSDVLRRLVKAKITELRSSAMREARAT